MMMEFLRVDVESFVSLIPAWNWTEVLEVKRKKLQGLAVLCPNGPRPMSDGQWAMGNGQCDNHQDSLACPKSLHSDGCFQMDVFSQNMDQRNETS
jgi:hypothetical protein